MVLSAAPLVEPSRRLPEIKRSRIPVSAATEPTAETVERFTFTASAPDPLDPQRGRAADVCRVGDEREASF